MNHRGGPLATVLVLCVTAGASACTGNVATVSAGGTDAAADGTTGNGDDASGALDAGAGDGGLGGPIGSPCTPEQERDPSFNGFVFQEIGTEFDDSQCQSHLCLVNHFQGRVSCP
jgi:hypothetical protein